MRHTTRLLLLSLLVLSLAGCHQSVVPTAEEQQADGCERPVRITARILPSDAPLRALGDVKDDIDDDLDTPFTPEEVIPNKKFFDEDRIDHVMLYVYDNDEMIKTVFYHDPTINAGMPTASDGLEVKTFGKDADTFTFDLLLSPGRYRFVLLVNDPHCYYEAKKGHIRLPEKIYLDRITQIGGFLSSEVLMSSRKNYRVTHPRVIPMTGQAMLTIPKGNVEGTATTVTPSIDLERVFARVEIILTTANTANKDESEYLSPEIANYTVDNREYFDGINRGRLTSGKLVDLVDRDCRAGTLEILPTKGEYTATGRGMSVESRLYSDRTAEDYLQYFRNVDTYRTTVTTRYAESMDIKDVFVDRSTLPKMYHQRSNSIWSKFTLNLYYLYIPPMYIDGLEKEDMPYILIGINTTGKDIPADAPVEAEQMTYFHLPITTLVSAAGDEKFEIRRNTTYSIYAAFRGGRLILNDGIKVLPWKVENETIEVDINDATTPPVIPIEK